MNIDLVIVKEDKSDKYPPRTFYNARSADVTLALAVDLSTAGEKLTLKAAGDKYVGIELTPWITSVEASRVLYRKLKRDSATTLNIAGNGIYTLCKHGWQQETINQFVYELVSQVNRYIPIERIFTGGQTGVDIAGAVTGCALSIPTEVTLPKGFIQRFEDNKDVKGSVDKVIEQIYNGASKLNPYQPI